MTDSPLDEKVKKGVLVDAIKMLNLSWRRKNRYINNARAEKHKRLTGVPRASNHEKEELRQKKTRIKDKFELNNLGNYERIYPLMPEDLHENPENQELQDKFDELIAASKDVYAESAAGGFQKKKETEVKVKSPDRSAKEVTRKDSS